MVNNIQTRQLDSGKRPDTDTYFSNLFDAEFVIPVDQESAIQTYFESYLKDKDSASLMTNAVVVASLAQNLNPMSVLADFKKLQIGRAHV